MNNVIHVEFGKKNAVEQQGASLSEDDRSLSAYLDSLRVMGVDEDDVLETLSAIRDMNVYFESDEVIQEFANGWFDQIM